MTNNLRFEFDITNDYSKQMNKYIDYLFDFGGSLKQEERVVISNRLIETYYAEIGKMPSANQLNRLGSYLLWDNLVSTKRNKKDSKNPVLTKKQLKERRRHETRFHVGM